jgi:hypothetical protein
MCAIKLKHTYHYTLIDEALGNMTRIPIVSVITGTDTAQETGKVLLYQWMRVSHYTTDCFACLACANLITCVSAIIKTVLNSAFLAQHVNVREFIKQAENINKLNAQAHSLSKMNEQVPYAPYRLKNLMGYASSERGFAALKELQNQKGAFILCSY